MVLCVCVRACVRVRACKCCALVQTRMGNVHLHNVYWWVLMCVLWINLWDSACSYTYLCTVSSEDSMSCTKDQMLHTHTHIHIHTHILTHTHTYTHTYALLHMWQNMTCIHTHTHTHIHIHVYTDFIYGAFCTLCFPQYLYMYPL